MRYLFVLLLSSAAMLLVFWIGLFAYSAIPVSPSDSLAGIFFPDQMNVAQVLVHEIRVPRIIVALIVGACLAVSGALMQALTQNSLASPGLFGVNAGAALGVALVSTFFVTNSSVSSTSAAMIGGGVTWTLVMTLGGGWSRYSQRGQLVLAGIAISALCGAIIKASILLVEEQASSVMVWLAGSFAAVDWETVSWLIPSAVISLVISMFIAPKINLLAMGEGRAITLGVNLSRLRLLIGTLVLVMVGLSVSAVGSIAFVGLMIPHICRLCVGYDHRKLLPVCMIFGGTLCVIADVLSRAITFPTETPAGAVLALIGAPCFLYLVRRKVS